MIGGRVLECFKHWQTGEEKEGRALQVDLERLTSQHWLRSGAQIGGPETGGMGQWRRTRTWSKQTKRAPAKAQHGEPISLFLGLLRAQMRGDYRSVVAPKQSHCKAFT